MFTQAIIKFGGSFIQIWNAAKDETAVLRRENKIMKTNERKYLDISTAHLTQGTFRKLNSMHLPYAYNYDEGVFITVPSKNEIGTIIMPDDLRIVLQYAWDNDIDLIRMDRDAEVCDDLPVYEWSMENLQLAGRTVAMADLPFGTKVEINGQIYTVEDRGVPSGCVDIYVDSHSEALNSGMYYAEVRVVG